MKNNIVAFLSILLLIPACVTSRKATSAKKTVSTSAESSTKTLAPEVMVFEEEIDSFSLQDDDIEYTSAPASSDSSVAEPRSTLVVDDRDTESYPFETIYFDFDKSQVREDQKNALKENVKLAKKAAKEGRTIVIEGHTCGFGTKAHNQLLSLNRAQGVANFAKSEGIPASSIKVVGRGSDMMLVASGDKAQQAPNRRVEMYVDIA